VRDEVRQELVFRQLAAHLPQTGEGLRVLDVGCGQGTQAIRLARSGHTVLGIDNNEQMLRQANAWASKEPQIVRTRVRFEWGDVLALGDTTRERYDVVCCHGVAMYLPSLADLVSALIRVASPRALISLLTTRRDCDACGNDGAMVRGVARIRRNPLHQSVGHR
jgi:2-polyprenyl-3-methyl-5-hydroxy-6-metoxy-1,4-benzoquinol methylase